MIADLLSQRGLSLDRLQSFCMVAHAGGVTKAARGNAAKQSQYSRQIKDLEVYFGTELMRRRGKGIELTEAGKRLEVAARGCFSVLGDFKNECTGKPSEVVIGAGESMIRWLMLPRLGPIREKIRTARFRLLNLETGEAITRLSEGVIDFAVVRRESVKPPLRHIRLGRLKYSLFAPAKVRDKFNTRRILAWLGELPLATLEGDGSFRQGLALIATQKGIDLRIELECSSFPLVASALKAGDLAAVLPSVAAGELIEAGLVEIQSEILKPLEREYCLAWSPRTQAIRSVLPSVQRMLTTACQF